MLLSVCAAAGRQSSAASDPAAGQSDLGNVKFTAQSHLVFLPTLVRNKKGETIYGLKAEQFIVEDNGIRQAVQVDEEPDSSGLSLVVLVQCSRSAPSEFIKLKGLAAMVDAIVGDAPHEVAVAGFGVAPYVLGGFSKSPESVRLALSRLKPCGTNHASSIDAVYYAINMLRRQNNHYRRAILLISEMRDQGSHAKLPEVVAELGITDTAIYSVAFSPAKDDFIDAFRHGNDSSNGPMVPPPKSTPEPESAAASASPPPDPPLYRDKPLLIERLLPPQFMVMVNALRRNTASQLASLSGGESFTFGTQKKFEQSLERISNQIHNSYVLRFQPASGSIMALHSITVRVAGHPDAVIQTRRNYWSGIFESTGSGR